MAAQWHQLQGELSVRRPPEERLDHADRVRPSERADYPNGAERLTDTYLACLERGERSPEERIDLLCDVAAVNSFESNHTDGADLGGAVDLLPGIMSPGAV